MAAFLKTVRQDNLRQRHDPVLQRFARRVHTAYAAGGLAGLHQQAQNDTAEIPAAVGYYRAVDRDGREIGQTSRQNWDWVAAKPDLFARVAQGQFHFRTLKTQRTRILTSALPNGLVLHGAHRLADDAHLMARFEQAALTALLILITVGGGLGWLLANRTPAGIRQITAIAGKIAQGGFQPRAQMSQHTQKVVQLVTTFNLMLERIASLIGELKEVTNNVAHDLRSPLTRIRGHAEVVLCGNPTGEQYRQVAITIVEERSRLEATINTMLDMAALEGEIFSLIPETVDFAQIVSSAGRPFCLPRRRQ